MCYYFSDKKSNWQDAYWGCQDLNASLAILETTKQDVALKNSIRRLKVGEYHKNIL